MSERKSKMLPAYERLKTDENRLDDQKNRAGFTVAFGKFSLFTVSLPLFSFIFCVAYSVIFLFEESVSTHCHVWNYLPSISAAIGAFPQNVVWQTAIVLHFIPRLTVTWMYYNHYTQNIRRNRQGVANLAIFLNLAENVCLLGLSLYNSTDYYGESPVTASC